MILGNVPTKSPLERSYTYTHMNSEDRFPGNLVTKIGKGPYPFNFKLVRTVFGTPSAARNVSISNVSFVHHPNF